MSIWNPDKDELLDTAIKQGIPSEIAVAALERVDVDSIRQLVGGLNKSSLDPYTLDGFIWYLMNQVETDAEKAIQILPTVLDIDGEGGPYSVVFALGQLGTPEALAFVRIQLESKRRSVRDAAVSTIIQYEYHNDLREALSDEVETVQHEAARQLERREDAVALLEAITHPSFNVRRVAAWYMGRKKVSESVKPLIERLKVESDMETLRAVIWTLGVLRDAQAISALEGFIEHPIGLVGTAARIALSKMGYGKEAR